jgi:hypothetical protein
LERPLRVYTGAGGVLKKYLIAAMENKDQCLCYLESSEGIIVPSLDLKNCELLRDVYLLHQDIRVSRNGRSIYKISCLTGLGRKMAQKMREEGLVSEEHEKGPRLKIYAAVSQLAEIF